MYKNRIEHDWKIYQISCKGKNSAEKRFEIIKNKHDKKKRRAWISKNCCYVYLVFIYTLLLHNKWLVLKLNTFKLNSRIHQFKFEREKDEYVFFVFP